MILVGLESCSFHDRLGRVTILWCPGGGCKHFPGQALCVWWLGREGRESNCEMNHILLLYPSTTLAEVGDPLGLALERGGGPVPDRPDLGTPPDDLVEVLAIVALAGPGVCAHRALRRITNLDSTDPKLLSGATRVAQGPALDLQHAGEHRWTGPSHRSAGRGIGTW